MKQIYGDDYIKYWRDKSYQHFNNSPVFVSTYIDQLEWIRMKDGDDYVAPDSTYVDCYPYGTNNGLVSFNLFCLEISCIFLNFVFIIFSHLIIFSVSHYHHAFIAFY